LSPLFPATLLTNNNYTNVTGGQRVELTLIEDRTTILSGVKAESHLEEADILFQGGLIHIIDSVLSIPISLPSTITRAGLTNLVALLDKGGFLKPGNPAINIVNDVSDLTVFGPDSPQFGPGFTGFETIPQQQLNAMLNYSIIQSSPPVYSSEFRNNTKLESLLGTTPTLRQFNNDYYLDAAKITKQNFLTSNGVLQIIDQPLNPDASGAIPVITDVPEPLPTKSKGLSTPAAAGLGVGVTALLLGLGIVLALIFRSRRRKGLPLFGNPRRFGPSRQRLPEQETPGIPKPRVGKGGSRSTSRQLQHQGDGSEVELAAALPPYYGAHELDNKAFPSPSGSPLAGGGGRGARGPGHARGHSRGGSYNVVEITGPDGSVRTIRDRPLPEKPPSPKEIDGTERSRISISISGEAPRHLGFQARY
jgi:uncharacterized surface protein with fasciclin (FAS1) repeats